MNAVTRIGNVTPKVRLRFPPFSVTGLAGTSFKHEHLQVIVGQGKHAELLESCEVYQQLYERQLFAAPV